MIAAHRGLPDAARSSAGAGLALARRLGDVRLTIRNLHALGFGELSLGDPASASAWLEDAVVAFETAGYREPGVFRFEADAAEALVARGDLPRAAERIASLEERGRGLSRASAVAAAARCRGMLAAAEGDLERANDVLETAVCEHDRRQQPLERARTLLALGTVQRRRRRWRMARTSLTESLQVFDRAGASAWAAKAQAELARIGGGVPRGDGLTPTEQRVADLVAAGRSNKEIAAELYLSVKTVEGNVSKVFRKLEVRSRSELAARVARVR